MFSIKAPSKIVRYSSLLLHVAGLAVFTAVVIFCCFYLLSDHDKLAAWYINLNNCFYHAPTWSTDFFTPGIKSDGNVYCSLGILIAVAGSIYTLKQIKKNKLPGTNLVFTLSYADLICTGVCIIICACLWQWGNRSALPAFDEAFSAQHVADIHPLQGVSYYMLPNNHIFFNLLNNILFRYATDKVLTGRIISLIAYCSVIVSLYFIFKSLFKFWWMSLLACITLSLQFFVWGFSFQARGYEVYLLAEWGMIASLFGFLQSDKKGWLHINTLCVIIGYFCLPSFLYFHTAQLLFMLLYSLFYKKATAQFWKYQLMAILFTFLCYLPVLLFSGVESITHNDYVTPRYQTMAVFWEDLSSPVFKAYLSHIYSDLRIGTFDITLFLLFSPLLLLLARKNKALASAGLFYLCMLLSYIIIAAVMKRMPFERNLAGHYSVSLAMLFLLIYWLSGLLTFRAIQSVVVPVVLVIFGVHFATTNEKLLKETLYEYNVNEMYRFHQDRLNIIPAVSTVGFSDAEFYSYCICRRNGCIVKKCPDGNEAYYVTQDNEGYPTWLNNNYQLLHKVYNYEIYKHR
ncbi:MAG: hypothetical protein K0Q79_3534 [Flavipsychrobacter sp.]|jgi:hypothetical protein|nr:hypothetical protein [Flavipsychrobacter sp.]